MRARHEAAANTWFNKRNTDIITQRVSWRNTYVHLSNYVVFREKKTTKWYGLIMYKQRQDTRDGVMLLLTDAAVIKYQTHAGAVFIAEHAAALYTTRVLALSAVDMPAELHALIRQFLICEHIHARKISRVEII